MVLPFLLPGPLQAFRSKMFYWRNVLYYRLLVDSKGYADNMVSVVFFERAAHRDKGLAAGLGR